MSSSARERLNEMLSDMICTRQRVNPVELEDCLRAVTWSERNEILTRQLDGGNTVLHFASQYGDVAAVRCLVNSLEDSEKYSLLEIQNYNGRTAVHLASYCQNTEILRHLLALPTYAQQKELLSITDYSGSAALDLAVEFNNTKMTLFLEEYNCAVAVRQSKLDYMHKAVANLEAQVAELQTRIHTNYTVEVKRNQEVDEFIKRKQKELDEMCEGSNPSNQTAATKAEMATEQAATSQGTASGMSEHSVEQKTTTTQVVKQKCLDSTDQ